MITINISGLTTAHRSALAAQIESWCRGLGFSEVHNSDPHSIWAEDEERVHPEPTDFLESAINITTSQLVQAKGCIPKFGQ